MSSLFPDISWKVLAAVAGAAVTYRIIAETIKFKTRERRKREHKQAEAERKRVYEQNTRRLRAIGAAAEERWQNFYLPRLRDEFQQGGSTAELIVAVEAGWVRRVEKDQDGRGPYLQFDTPDDSLRLDECGRWLEGAMETTDDAVSLHLEVVGLTDDGVLFASIRFPKPEHQQEPVRVTWQDKWNEPLKVYLGSDLEERGLFLPYDVRKDYAPK